ncbi:MAG: RelA/SpoT family protein [Nitrospinales bacterium]
MRTLEEITSAVLEYHPSADVGLIYDAYLYTAKAHRGQSRKSGEAYLSHPMEVAFNLTRLKMDEETVAAGLLHDTIEDTLSTPEEIIDGFGEEVYSLVDGVTKIGQVKLASREEKQAENYRKMILAMARDIRVIMIKLADRTHNMETLDSVSAEQKKRISRETLDIYAPLANRLGISWVKALLEDGAFRHLYPRQYQSMVDNVHGHKEERSKYIETVCDLISKELADADLPSIVTGRPKHYYSIYKKMIDQNIDFQDVYDLLGIRILTKSVKDCYAVLGMIHSLWSPIPGKFKDYIAMPKPNMYQSLHTTVVGPDGRRVEVQIRTEEMQQVCEFGIAAHWVYKVGDEKQKSKNDDHLSWVRRLMEDQKDITNAKDFVNALKVDLVFQEVFVFTPQGEVIALPRDATPVDFAYQVHTDIGNHCFAAKANGKIVPLKYKLKNGERVEILTSKQKSPSRDWLSFVKTSKARSNVANFVNNLEREKSESLGKEILEKEFHKHGMDLTTLLKGNQMEEAIQGCGYNSLESLQRAIGIGKIPVQHFMEKLLPKSTLDEQHKNSPNVKLKKPEATPPTREDAIRVKCLDSNILWRIGKCCNPVPGENIVGYITRGRGVSVHREDCQSLSAFSGEPERFVDVEWHSDKKTSFHARISIITVDKPGLLGNICNVLSECNINITQANVQQAPNHKAHYDMAIEIFDLEHLNTVLQEIQQVEGVVLVERSKEITKSFSDLINQQEESEDASTSQKNKLTAS